MIGFLQPVWNGLVVGSIVALAALGFTLVFGVLNFLHVAYAEYVTFGAYVAYVGNVTLGLPMAVAFLGGVVATAVLALALHGLVFRHFTSESPVILIVVSLALSIILRNTVRVIWGNSVLWYDIPIRQAANVAGLKVLPDQILVIAVGAVVLGGMFYLLRRTRVGIAMRAVSDDTRLARVRGVDTDRMVAYTWLITGAIAGVAGVFLAVQTVVLPLMGFSLLPAVFAAVVLGGVGDPVGAIIGGYVIGLAEELSVLLISPQYKPAVGLVVLVVVLVLKPQGVFGTTTR